MAFAAIMLASCKKDSENDLTQQQNRSNKEAGEKFLMNNRDAEGVTETYSGLQYTIDTLGTGRRPTIEDSVTFTFTGSLVSGAVFAKNTVKMTVEEQIEGMKEGLMLMPQGSVFDLYIPYYLGYNKQAKQLVYKGKIVSIDAFSMLHYHVKLDSVYRGYTVE